MVLLWLHNALRKCFPRILFDGFAQEVALLKIDRLPRLQNDVDIRV